MTDGPGPSNSAAKRFGGVYQGAVEAVVALLLAMGAGYWADQKLDTAPRWLLVGTAIGFAAFVLRLWRMRSLVEPPRDALPPGPPE
jgi:F0F1-type ATP synthase assembly protein I